MLRKKRNEKNSLSLRQFFVLIAFFFRFSGPINEAPPNRYLIATRCGLWDPACEHLGYGCCAAITSAYVAASQRFSKRERVRVYVIVY